MSGDTNPMRQLLAKNTQFVWEESQIKAFEKVKQVMTSSPCPVFIYFDQGIQVDAS